MHWFGYSEMQWMALLVFILALLILSTLRDIVRHLAESKIELKAIRAELAARRMKDAGL